MSIQQCGFFFFFPRLQTFVVAGGCKHCCISTSAAWGQTKGRLEGTEAERSLHLPDHRFGNVRPLFQSDLFGILCRSSLFFLSSSSE
ncbi:hypothetical protein KC19_11G110900 [Ceratodon purpureus]|uniref:Secreted protein n=1 Tax=Ceratodon purpureus TaxID=3225 RepID=A0A8T0GEW3_CERPU|nr:hypothetical protein KC19_11G110900 [Ceratodon purpureus]